MNRLDRYIISHILGLTAIVALALLAIHSFVTFVSQIDEIGTGDFGYRELLLYTLWQAPTGFYVMLPIIAMLGTLLGLGTLASQSELTAMRASGFSLLRIGRATLWGGVILGALCFAVGDWLAPRGQVEGDALMSEAQTGVRGVTAKPVWLREGDNVFRIRSLIAEDHIAAVEIYTLGPDLNLQAATMVDEGFFRDGAWRFRGVRRTEFGASNARVVEQAEMDWRGTLSPDVLRLFVLEAEALSSAGLWRLIGYLDDNNLDSRAYALTLARKLVAPLTVMAMMLFAIPFVMGQLRNTGAGQRLFIGVLVGLVFYVVNEVSANTGQLYGWNPLVSAGAPTLALAMIGLWRLQRVR
ncbi:MAG: LPS export ABC transporter permease LptG [Gammaproteobacteria bacterium]